MRKADPRILFLVIVLMAASCGTSRVNEIIKSNAVITEILVERIEDPKCTDKPTRKEMENFAQSTKRDFQVLKKSGKPINSVVYAKAENICERIDKGDSTLTDYELIQFMKSVRDVYKFLTEENQKP